MPSPSTIQFERPSGYSSRNTRKCVDLTQDDTEVTRIGAKELKLETWMLHRQKRGHRKGLPNQRATKGRHLTRCLEFHQQEKSRKRRANLRFAAGTRVPSCFQTHVTCSSLGVWLKAFTNVKRPLSHREGLSVRIIALYSRGPHTTYNTDRALAAS